MQSRWLFFREDLQASVAAGWPARSSSGWIQQFVVLRVGPRAARLPRGKAPRGTLSGIFGRGATQSTRDASPLESSGGSCHGLPGPKREISARPGCLGRRARALPVFVGGYLLRSRILEQGPSSQMSQVSDLPVRRQFCSPDHAASACPSRRWPTSRSYAARAARRRVVDSPSSVADKTGPRTRAWVRW